MTRKNYPKLTVDELRGLRWRMRSHVNGGRNFSSMLYWNEKYGLMVSSVTNGSPKYELESKILHCEGDPDDHECQADLLAEDKESQLERFVTMYNDRQLEVRGE